MLKFIVGLLIVVNAVIFLWGKNMTAPRPELKPVAVEAVSSAPSIQLVRERVEAHPVKTPEMEVVETLVAPEVTPPVVVTTEPECGRIGPFVNQIQMEKALLDLDLASKEIEQTETRLQKGYWVLIPALPSREAATGVVTKLRVSGFNDVWLFNRGPLKNAISLGLFSHRSNADRHADSVNKQGFSTEVRPKTVEGTQYWITYQGIAGETGVERLPVEISREKKACD